MNNYQCQKCSTVVQSDSIPTSNGCPDASFHKWTNLAPVGDTNYQCKKCGTLIKASRTPTTNGCPSATFHQWTKL